MTGPTIDAILAAIRETSAKATQGAWESQWSRLVKTSGSIIATAERSGDQRYIVATQPHNMVRLLAYIDDLEAIRKIAHDSILDAGARANRAEERADHAEATAQALAATLGRAERERLAATLGRAERERDEAGMKIHKSQWRPIECAPKTGKFILGKEGYRSPDRQDSGMVRYRIHVTQWVEGEGWIYYTKRGEAKIWTPDRWRQE